MKKRAWLFGMALFQSLAARCARRAALACGCAGCRMGLDALEFVRGLAKLERAVPPGQTWLRDARPWSDRRPS